MREVSNSVINNMQNLFLTVLRYFECVNQGIPDCIILFFFYINNKAQFFYLNNRLFREDDE